MSNVEILAIVSLSLFFGIVASMLAWLQDIRNHKKELEEARADAIKRSKRVIRAKVSEDLIPLFPGFPYELADLKLFSQPIDYIVFEGMSEFRDGNKAKELTIILADLKTGNAVKTPVQKEIMKAIDAGRIRFEEWRVDENNNLTIQ